MATLSNFTFVITKNENQFEFGLVAEALQTKNCVVLPHFGFSIDLQYDAEHQIHQEIMNILNDNPLIAQLVTHELNDGNGIDPIQKLVDRFLSMLNDTWKSHRHVFQVVITNCLAGAQSQSYRANRGIIQHPAISFLEEIKKMLPKHYINIPLRGFDFTIRGEKIKFVYWQNRLVELTKFELNIPNDRAIIDMPDDSNWVREGYDLSVFCGFDAVRLHDKHGKHAKTCQLCIYSRQSGRLIEVTDDARDVLGLPSTGIDFSQGLTIIVDDVLGELPLKPTKDGLAWSKERLGDVHKSNLFAWAGAVGYLYWHYHFGKFDKVCKESKSLLSSTIVSFVDSIEERQEKMASGELSENVERLAEGKFSMFSEVTWKKEISKNSRKMTIRKKMLHLDLWPGPDTVFKFNDNHYKIDGSSKFTPKNAERIPLKRESPALADQQSSESSSGSEEEEILDRPQEPVRKVARRRSSSAIVKGEFPSSAQAAPVRRTSRRRTSTSSAASQTNAGSFSSQVAAAIRRRPSSSSKSRSQKLEKELQEKKDELEKSQVREQQLESDLRNSKDYAQQLEAKVRQLEEDNKKARKQLFQSTFRQTPPPTSDHNITTRLKAENALLKQQKAELEREIETLKCDLLLQNDAI